MLNSVVTQRTAGGQNSLPLETYLLGKRKVFLNEAITRQLANDVVGKLMYLVMEDPIKPIDLLIDSGGGDVDAGMIIYDAIQSMDTPIRMIDLGAAHSMAAILFASGRHGRYMLPHAQVMIHDPRVENCPGGSTEALERTTRRLSQVRREMHKVLSKHTGKPISELEKATSFDNFLNAEEAIAFGICDGIIGMRELMEDGEHE